MRIAWLIPVLALVAPMQLSAAELTEEEFTRLHKELRPAKDEPYLSIPWKTSLLEAQRVAIKEKKPIFIWAMDGHPLGCT